VTSNLVLEKSVWSSQTVWGSEDTI